MCCPTDYVKQTPHTKAQAGIEPRVTAPPRHQVSHFLSKSHVNPKRCTMHYLAGMSQECDHMMRGARGVLRRANMSPSIGIKAGWTTVRLCTGRSSSVRHISAAGHHYLGDVSTGFSSAHTINDATAARRKMINKILLWDVNKRHRWHSG